MKKKIKKKLLWALPAIVVAIAAGLGLSETASDLITVTITATLSVVCYFIADTCIDKDSK
ncbi:MAG: hypothetical protein FWC66_05125 [Oscillospiraceae bacterium]|nr:hypothetical protein [Oscillospiraceae bacterium]